MRTLAMSTVSWVNSRRPLMGTVGRRPRRNDQLRGQCRHRDEFATSQTPRQWHGRARVKWLEHLDDCALQ
jgi:hypothetical protein